MLLNEFLKGHKEVEEQEVTIAQLNSEIQTVVAQLKELALEIQKVIAQVDLQKSPARTVVNNQ